MKYGWSLQRNNTSDEFAKKIPFWFYCFVLLAEFLNSAFKDDLDTDSLVYFQCLVQNVHFDHIYNDAKQ